MTDAVADLQIELAEGALEDHWDGFPDAERFDLLSRDTLIPEDALRALAAEMPARADLWAGKAIEDVAADHPELSRARIASLASQVETGRKRLAAGKYAPREQALMLRLPAGSMAPTDA